MLDQYFGLKELSQVTLRARTSIQFGSRRIEEGEPILYFENVSMSVLNERNSIISARGGWENRPRVVWDSRQDVTFTLQEGVLSSVGMSMLLSANAVARCVEEKDYILVPMREELKIRKTLEVPKARHYILPTHKPHIDPPRVKMFLLQYDRDNIQRKVYGRYEDVGEDEPCIVLYYDKNLQQLVEDNYEYCLADYYYEYSTEDREANGEEAPLVYTLSRDRFNGLFTLEGKFYSKDENDGMNYINLLYMPKVRIVSDINLRLGEKANPTVSVFNIIGLPVNEGGTKDNMILEITRLDKVEDEEF